jgi:hypothetical protein
VAAGAHQVIELSDESGFARIRPILHLTAFKQNPSAAVQCAVGTYFGKILYRTKWMVLVKSVLAVTSQRYAVHYSG